MIFKSELKYSFSVKIFSCLSISKIGIIHSVEAQRNLMPNFKGSEEEIQLKLLLFLKSIDTHFSDKITLCILKILNLLNFEKNIKK